MSTPNELRVFISSTFRDLQEEREHLVKKIFPEIRALCRERGITFTEVDLRWGITEDEAEREGVIRICLEEIDRCRPYFIGILGDRYGWRPPATDMKRLANDFPDLAGRVTGSPSITEMEIVHGVLTDPAMARRAFFYFRNPAATPPGFVDPDEESIRRLRNLKQRIRQSGLPVRENFDSPEDLGRQVLDDLRDVVARQFPETYPPDAHQTERRAQAAFAASRIRAYVPDTEACTLFDQWIASPSAALIVSGASGMGKSSLLAYLADEFRARSPRNMTIDYYVGALSGGGSAISVMRYVVEELHASLGLHVPIPQGRAELQKEFPNLLFRAALRARERGADILIAIDALNQLDEPGRRLAWLPVTFPPGIRVVVSTTPDDLLHRLIRRGWKQIEMRPVVELDVRAEIVRSYLAQFSKRISSHQTQRLVTDAKASSPLYVRVVAEEMRIHGEHETLDAIIDAYASAQDLHDVFDRMLQRMESDHGADTINELLCLIWTSRFGLDETELLELTGLNRLSLSRILHAFDYHMMRRDGRLSFFHEYLRRAVEHRYLRDRDVVMEVHLRLATYFESMPVDTRVARELLWHFTELGDADRQRDTLCRCQAMLALWNGDAMYEALASWAALRERGVDPGASLLSAIDDCARHNPDPQLVTSTMNIAADMLERLGCWDASIDVYRLLRDRALGDQRHDQAPRYERMIGTLLCWKGDYDRALRHLERALNGYRKEANDALGEAVTITAIGMVHQRRGELEQALRQFQQGLAMAVRSGDRDAEADALGDIGVVCFNRGDYSLALEHFQRQRDIAEEIGNHRLIAMATGNMGMIHFNRGEMQNALDCFKRNLLLAEAIGDLGGVASAVGNLGVIHRNLGDLHQALEAFDRQRTLCEETGDRGGAAKANGNIGNVYVVRGEYDRALEHYKQQLRMSEEMGDRDGIARSTGNMGAVYIDIGSFGPAVECFERIRELFIEMGDASGLAATLGYMGSAYRCMNRLDDALRSVSGAIDGFRAIGERRELDRFLGERGRILLDAHEREQMPPWLPGGLVGADATNWRRALLHQARMDITTSLELARDMQNPETTFAAEILMGRLHAAENDRSSAQTLLEQLVETSRDDHCRAEALYWLWKMNNTDDDRGQALLELYESLLAITPKYDYRKRIEALRGPVEPDTFGR